MTTHAHVHHHHHKHPLVVHHIEAFTPEELHIILECLHKLHVHRQGNPNATDNSAEHLLKAAHAARQGSNVVHLGTGAATDVVHVGSGPANVAPAHQEEDPFEAMQKAAMAPANTTHNPHLKPDGTHYTAEEVVTFQKELFKSGKLSAPKAREIWAKVGASAKTAPTPEQCGQLMYDLRQVH